MLKQMSTDMDYRAHLKFDFNSLSDSQKNRFKTSSFKDAMTKMMKLALDPVRDIIFGIYSNTGRPGLDPAVFLRSFILMNHFKFTSISEWVNEASNDDLYKFLVGTDKMPGISSHYDFINRIMNVDPHRTDLALAGLFLRKNKDKRTAQLKKNMKWENCTVNDVSDLVKSYENGASQDSDRIIYTMQTLFNALCVIPSIDKGLLDPNGIFSGDGSALHIHAQSAGHKVIESDDPDADTTRYSAAGANIGWDSDLGQWYYGFTEYNISQHNPAAKVDLPVFITLEAASRHDSLTGVSAIAQMMDMNQDLHPKCMCLDSAHDAKPIYSFLIDRHIAPIIDLNKRRMAQFKNLVDGEKDYTINENGIPVCRAGHEMAFDGSDYGRMRDKYRCPLRRHNRNSKKIDSCPFDNCSDSSFGRVVYTFMKDNPRYFGPVPRGSQKYKDIYKNRTCTERINKRILNDYCLHSMHVRDYAKIAFFMLVACINIHLDAWIKMK